MQRARSCPRARSLGAVTVRLSKPTHRPAPSPPTLRYTHSFLLYFIIRLKRVRQDLGWSLNFARCGCIGHITVVLFRLENKHYQS